LSQQKQININLNFIIMNTIKFPQPKKIDYRKFIEPKKQIFVTKNGLTTALLINR
jgi:hypothetical protein